MPKVSIIIPFNNVESYIKQCLESVINQKLQDIEIICVNDASDDGTGQIVKEYADKDNRIKIIDLKERKGQGFARNRAMEIAAGEYIGFVDADDYIESDMFFDMYSKAKQSDDDITMCQAREYDDMNKKFILSDYYSLSCLWPVEDNVFSAIDVKDKLLDINVVLWNKIYKKSFLDKIGERFPEGYIYEDLPFFFGTFLCAEKIQIVWKNLYIYRINRKNSTMQQFNNKILDRLDMVSLTYEKLKQFDFLSDIMPKIKGWIINDLFHRYTLLKENCQKEFFFKMKKIFQGLEIDNLENPYWKKVYHFEGFLMVLNNDFDSFNQKIFTRYLDIHMVEDRLRSEISIAKDVCYRLDKLKEYTDNNASRLCDVENKFFKIQYDVNLGFSNIYDERKNNYEMLKSLIENTSSNLENKIKEEEKKNNDINQKIDNNQLETEKQIQQKIREINEKTDSKIIDNHKTIQEEINELKVYFDKIILEQKMNYEKEIDNLKERIFQLERTPIQKLKDRIKKTKKNA